MQTQWKQQKIVKVLLKLTVLPTSIRSKNSTVLISSIQTANIALSTKLPLHHQLLETQLNRKERNPSRVLSRIFSLMAWSQYDSEKFSTSQRQHWASKWSMMSIRGTTQFLLLQKVMDEVNNENNAVSSLLMNKLSLATSTLSLCWCPLLLHWN